jgi:hypothetical protein
MKRGATLLEPGTDVINAFRNSFIGPETLENLDRRIRKLGKLAHVGHAGRESHDTFFCGPGAASEAGSLTLTLATAASARACDSGKMVAENKRNRYKNKPTK